MEEIICVVCPVGCLIKAREEKGSIKIKGYRCRQGKLYAEEEFKNPVRMLTGTVRISAANLPLLPVKSAGPLPKKILQKAMRELARVQLKAPVEQGEVILANILNTGVDIVATRSMEKGGGGSFAGNSAE